MTSGEARRIEENYREYRKALPDVVREAIGAGAIRPVLELASKHGYDEWNREPIRSFEPLAKLAAVYKLALVLPELADLHAQARMWLTRNGFKPLGER